MRERRTRDTVEIGRGPVPAEPEIADERVALFVEENIPRFQISM